MTIYIIRYALTTGIIKRDVHETDGTVFAWGFSWYPTGPDNRRYYLTEAEALAAAEEMRAKKLVLLEKQRAKLVVKKIAVVAK